MTYEYPHLGPIRSRTRRAFKPRWAFGFGLSLLGALSVSLAAILNAATRGSLAFPEYGVSLWGILGAYWCAAALCGALLSLTYPLLRRRWGAALVGFGLGFITYGVVGILLVGARPLALGVAVIPAILIGAGLGVVLYDESHA